MDWKPLFSNDDEKEGVVSIIESITNDLSLHKSRAANLFGGNAGISIFWQYLYEFQENKDYKKRSYELLESSLRSIEATPQVYTFSSGIAGILWSACHLNRRRANPLNLEEIIGEDIDVFLGGNMQDDFHRGNCDYLHGAPGMALYFLERGNIPYSIKSLNEVFMGIERNSVKLNEGLAWKDYFNDEMPTYNLGLSHGSPSLVVILSRIMQFHPDISGLENLLNGSVEWILSRKSENGTKWLFPTTYPWKISPDSRLAWCYGDLGIAIAIFQAGMVMKNMAWVDEAIEIALYTTQKRGLTESGVWDACLCHGTAGIAHIYNRFYQHTGNSSFKFAAIHWYKQTILQYKSSVGLKTRQWNEAKENLGWITNYGLLEGIAGIGLALISSVCEVEPKWDRCLLLS